jgi:hypothetical protein
LEEEQNEVVSKLPIEVATLDVGAVNEEGMDRTVLHISISVNKILPLRSQGPPMTSNGQRLFGRNVGSP